jgi:hypothetical protein
MITVSDQACMDHPDKPGDDGKKYGDRKYADPPAKIVG